MIGFPPRSRRLPIFCILPENTFFFGFFTVHALMSRVAIVSIESPRSVVIMTDPLSNLSADECEAVRLFLDRYRADRNNGERWDKIWPEVQGMFAMPIPMPNGRDEEHSADDEVQYEQAIRTTSRPSTPAPESSPRLECSDREETDDELPPDDSPLDEDILGVLRLAEKPLKRETIARRAHRSNNTYLSTRLRRLVEQGRVRVVDNCFYALNATECQN